MLAKVLSSPRVSVFRSRRFESLCARPRWQERPRGRGSPRCYRAARRRDPPAGVRAAGGRCCLFRSGDLTALRLPVKWPVGASKIWGVSCTPSAGSWRETPWLWPAEKAGAPGDGAGPERAARARNGAHRKAWPWPRRVAARPTGGGGGDGTHVSKRGTLPAPSPVGGRGAEAQPLRPAAALPGVGAGSAPRGRDGRHGR